LPFTIPIPDYEDLPLRLNLLTLTMTFLSSIAAAAQLPAAGPSPAATQNPAAKETVLFDFEEDNALQAWSMLVPSDPKEKEPEVRRDLSGEHVTSGKASLKLTFAGGRFPTVTTPAPVADWTGFKAFKADVTASRACVVVFRALHEKSTRGGHVQRGGRAVGACRFAQTR